MSPHAAAMALFVPVRLLNAGFVQVTRQAAVVAVLIGTCTDQMAWSATKEAGQQLLQTHTHQYITQLAVVHTCPSVGISCTHFRFRAVFGEMSHLVAVSTLDALSSIVSVWNSLHGEPGALVSVKDLSLKHRHSC